MEIKIRLTAALSRWLRESHDDGTPELRVRQLSGSRVEVTRADGSELSDTERLEVEARVAAHRAEPLR